MIRQFTVEEAKKLINENENVLLIFSTQWCGKCKMNTLIWNKVLPKYEKEIKVAKIDVDEQKIWVEDAKDFAIDTVPTIIGYKNGKQIFINQNFTSEPKLKELLTKF